MATNPQEEPRRHGLPQGSQSLGGGRAETGAMAACSLGCLAMMFVIGVIWATIYAVIF